MLLQITFSEAVMQVVVQLQQQYVEYLSDAALNLSHCAFDTINILESAAENSLATDAPHPSECKLIQILEGYAREAQFQKEDIDALWDQLYSHIPPQRELSHCPYGRDENIIRFSAQLAEISTITYKALTNIGGILIMIEHVLSEQHSCPRCQGLTEQLRPLHQLWSSTAKVLRPFQDATMNVSVFMSSLYSISNDQFLLGEAILDIDEDRDATTQKIITAAKSILQHLNLQVSSLKEARRANG